MHRQNLQSKAANANFPVDLIRTVAIFLVILVHATMFPYSVMGTMTAPAEFDWWTTNVYGAIANLSVPLFVMLSGVLLLNPAKADEPLDVFFKKRFARIGLPMIFWTIGYFAWGYFVHGTPFTMTVCLGAF
jgi:surface polysaccharide O-acyltransferase-like enzyme